jgi:hypothetical protein
MAMIGCAVTGVADATTCKGEFVTVPLMGVLTCTPAIDIAFAARKIMASRIAFTTASRKVASV